MISARNTRSLPCRDYSPRRWQPRLVVVRTSAAAACPACFSGHLDEGTPTGCEVSIGPLPVYLSTPSKPNGAAIVISTDVFGYKLVNVRLIADVFASTGFTVFVPDLFEGDAIDMSALETMEAAQEATGLAKVWGTLRGGVRAATAMISWLPRHPVQPVLPRVKALITAIRADYGIEKVAVQGYCYGGKVAVLLGGEPDCPVDAIAAAHPSALEVPADIEPVKVPSIFLCADKDFMFGPAARTKAQQTLEAKQGIRTKFVVYPGTQHGFAVRGNKGDELVKRARADALQQAVTFLQQEFGLDAAESPAAALPSPGAS